MNSKGRKRKYDENGHDQAVSDDSVTIVKVVKKAPSKIYQFYQTRIGPGSSAIRGMKQETFKSMGNVQSGMTAMEGEIFQLNSFMKSEDDNNHRQTNLPHITYNTGRSRGANKMVHVQASGTPAITPAIRSTHEDHPRKHDRISSRRTNQSPMPVTDSEAIAECWRVAKSSSDAVATLRSQNEDWTERITAQTQKLTDQQNARLDELKQDIANADVKAAKLMAKLWNGFATHEDKMKTDIDKIGQRLISHVDAKINAFAKYVGEYSLSVVPSRNTDQILRHLPITEIEQANITDLEEMEQAIKARRAELANGRSTVEKNGGGGGDC